MVQCVIEPAAKMARRLVKGKIVAGIDMLAGVTVASTDTNDLSDSESANESEGLYDSDAEALVRLID